MKERNKIRQFIQGLKQIIVQNPVEACLACIFFILWCSLENYGGQFIQTLLRYSPMVFLVACILHHKTSGRLQILYYISPLLLIPFYWVNESILLRYLFTFGAIQLLYILSFNRKKDSDFIYSFLSYIKLIAITVFLSSVTWSVLLLITFSIRYIFDIWQGSSEQIIQYTQAFSYGLLAPLFFLQFNSMKEESKEAFNTFLSFLANFILSPALLIYSVILYLYIFKIILTFNLPKGQIAYLVTGFVSLLFLLKGCQSFLRQRYYDWFYRHASLLSIPTLILCWIGIYYRISQYGFTVPRVYLIVVVLLLTLLSLSFFTKKVSHYYIIAWTAVVITVGISYIPGISVQDIETSSQEGRDHSGNDSSSKIQFISIESNDPVDIASYHKAYFINLYRNEGNYFQTIHDSLFIYIENKLVLKEGYSQLLDIQLTKAGIHSSDSIPEEKYACMLEYTTDSTKLVFERLHIQRTDTTFQLTDALPKCYLMK